MSTEVAVPEHPHVATFEESLAAEQAAERDLLKSLMKSILVALPIMIGVFVLISALAISDKTDWYVWLGLGVGLGVIGAFLLGSLAGVTMNAHKLDDIDRGIFDH